MNVRFQIAAMIDALDNNLLSKTRKWMKLRRVKTSPKVKKTLGSKFLAPTGAQGVKMCVCASV